MHVAGSENKKVECSLWITAATPTQNLTIQATDAVDTKKSITATGYLIDRLVPAQ